MRQILGQTKDLGGGVAIQRYLPHAELRSIGPYVFFDYMPQLVFEKGKGSDVRPHPHIGLSTLSYILEGQMRHQDSLDTDIVIGPGDILLMTSGKGITHSERTPQALRQQSHRLHMFQFWLALPQSHEETEPAVAWAKAAELPEFELQPGVKARLAIGHYGAYQAPVCTHLNPLLLDIQVEKATEVSLHLTQAEHALMLIQGDFAHAGQDFIGPAFIQKDPCQMKIQCSDKSHFLVVGGDSLDGRRRVWWNFVASDPERIEQAKVRWRAGGFPKVRTDAEEFIPLPNEEPSDYAWYQKG